MHRCSEVAHLRGRDGLEASSSERAGRASRVVAPEVNREPVAGGNPHAGVPAVCAPNELIRNPALCIIARRENRRLRESCHNWYGPFRFDLSWVQAHNFKLDSLAGLTAATFELRLPKSTNRSGIYGGIYCTTVSFCVRTPCSVESRRT